MKLCLVVDDSDVIRSVAASVLSSIGYSVVEAASGQQAIELCQLRMPDAILLDRDMPGMGGHDFLGMYLGSFEGLKPYIVYATNEHDADDIAQVRELGVDDYILKPFERADLVAKFGSRQRAA
jgi:two-component system, chemotaxis family, chemotaxis protein CheY